MFIPNDVDLRDDRRLAIVTGATKHEQTRTRAFIFVINALLYYYCNSDAELVSMSMAQTRR